MGHFSTDATLDTSRGGVRLPARATLPSTTTMHQLPQEDRTDHTLWYLSALEKTGCESIETTVRRLRLLLAGRIHRMGNHRYPKRLLHGTLRKVGLVEKKRGWKVKCWCECLREDRKALGILDEGWLKV